MEGRISILTLLCVVLTGIGALVVTIPQTTYEVARGDNITLACNFKTTTANTPADIGWSAQAEQVDADEISVIDFYPGNKITDTGEQYAGRVSLDYDPSGKVNLKLSSVTLDDNKKFKCNVKIPSDGSKTATTRLLVLVAPSTPECNIQGKAEYGQNINLTCVSREGSPPPTYSWSSRDVQNNPRSFDPKTTDKGGILSLYNISKDTSGFFICTSTNKIRSATCNFTLSVMPPSMNIGSTAAIIGGIAAVLLVLGIIIYCCCCRKKNKEEEYAMGVHEEEYHKELAKNGDSRQVDGEEESYSTEISHVKSSADHKDHYEERSERGYDRRSDYDDRRSDYDDRRSDYSDRRDKYSDRHERYDDSRHNDDDRRYNDRRDRRYDEPYDDRDRGRDRDRDRPLVPSNKPPRRNSDD